MGSDKEEKIPLSPNWNLQTRALCNAPRSWKSSVNAHMTVMVCSDDSSAWLQGLCYPYLSQSLCFRSLDCISSRRVCLIDCPQHITIWNEFVFSNKPLWLLQSGSLQTVWGRTAPPDLWFGKNASPQGGKTRLSGKGEMKGFSYT